MIIKQLPVLIIKDKSCFGSEEDGVGTVYIPIKFCPECGRKTWTIVEIVANWQKKESGYEEKMCGYFQGTIANGYGNDFSKRSGKNVRPNGSDHITISEGGTHPKKLTDAITLANVLHVSLDYLSGLSEIPNSNNKKLWNIAINKDKCGTNIV